MCGITGIINFKKDIRENKTSLYSMAKTLTKRGPDEEGFYTSSNVLLAHRRLVVVDPEGGKQPMIKHIHSNEYVLVYNGELYNTEDLRKELLAKGFTFDSYSDTEVLLTSYMCWGASCLKKLNGIFAFAIYDKKENRIFLARDQMGVKPLFYTIKDNTLIFGSEIKTLLAHPLVDAKLDSNGITELFSLGPAVTPGSGVLKDIYEVEPASFIIFTEDNLKKEPYWELVAKENNKSESELTEELRYLLIDSFSRQLIGDVPLCVFLSGGLDSSAIAAITAGIYKKRNKQLTSYSIDYEDNDKYFKSSLFQPTSDQYWALEMSKFLGTNHKTVTINHRDLVNSLDDATLSRDLPGMADVDSSLYLFCKEIRKDYVIALSGECADELFGGYPWFTNNDMKYTNTFPWSRFIPDRISILNKDLKNLKINDFAQERYHDTLKKVPHLDNESTEDYRMRELFYLNLRWFMLTLLTRKDRMSMSNSLEVRVPFADYRLVEFAFNINSNMKLLNGREKGLLRKSLEGILPEDIIYRKKSPYPKTHNPIYTELVCSKLTSILNKPSSPILQLIDKDVVHGIVQSKGSSYTTPWYGQLMTGPQLIAYLIQVNTWLDSYNISIV